MNEKINSFQERTRLLRSEITDAIIGILKDNNLSELKLSQNPDEVPWVVWFDNRNYGYDSRVTKVLLDRDGIAVEVYDEDCCCSATMTSNQSDLACTNIDWLCKILDSISYTLSLPQSSGTIVIEEQHIKWSFDEPGLSEIPEEELEQVKIDLQNGQKEGKLCYYDDYDVEFTGTWKIKPI